MTLYTALPLISLGFFCLFARYSLGIRSASLGAGFVMWLSWSGLVGRALSASHLIDRKSLWLISELLPLTSLFLLNRRRFKKILRQAWFEIKAMPTSLRTACDEVWAIPILLAGVVLLYSTGLVANLLLPQVMDDSLTAYLPRAGFWITNQTTEFFRTSDYNFPLVSYPALPNFSTLRWIVLTGSEHAASLDQWLATLITGTLVFSLARKVCNSIGIAFFAALTWLFMPVTLMQSQMVLYDAVALVAIFTCINLACDLFAKAGKPEFLICALAFMVAIGTKQTVIFMLPSALASLVIMYFVVGKASHLKIIFGLKFLIQSFTITAIGVLIALPEYISNQKRFSHPLGPRESFGYFADGSVNFVDRISAMFENSLRVVVAGSLGDVPTNIATRFPELFDYARRSYPIAGTGVSRSVGVGWFGTSVTMFVLFGLTSFVFLLFRRRFQLSSLLLVLGGLLYTIFFMYTRANFSEAFSRYMWFPFTLFFLASVSSFEKIFPRSSKKLLSSIRQIFLLVIAVVSIGQGSWSFLGAGVRPLLGPQQVWAKSDDDIIMLSTVFPDSGAFLPMVEKLEFCESNSEPLGIYLPFKFPLSILFGENFKREVKMLDMPEGTLINLDFFTEQGVSALIFDDFIKKSIQLDFQGLVSQSFGQYTLVIKPSLKSGCR